MNENKVNHTNTMNIICANITLVAISTCIVALTIKFIMWLF